MKKRKSAFPQGWDEERVRQVIEHYETQSEEEAVAEDEAAFADHCHTMMEIPIELVPTVREILARHEQAKQETPAGHNQR